MIISSIGIFTFELLIIFVASLLATTQIFALKLSKVLDIIAIINTRIILGLLFICVISVYGILLRFIQVDLLRLRKQKESYWLEMDSASNDLRKQY